MHPNQRFLIANNGTYPQRPIYGRLLLFIIVQLISGQNTTMSKAFYPLPPSSSSRKQSGFRETDAEG